ncbi:MAG: BlaI/MecI/CopY family transcriptional regulator, partial [Bacteroidales bacterium]|nr:BlaI/MecI/CopY family transcriptional regulator [Bacteroidales bacterium]
MKKLTKKEEVIMDWFWKKGPMYIKELQELYPEPRPHFNTLSTQVRTLEANGYVSHKSFSGSFQYYATVGREDYNKMRLDSLIGKFFDNSYLSAVSSLVQDDKITIDELKDLIRQIEQDR